MAYRFGKVTYQNFGPFHDTEVDFSQDGLTIVEGLMDGVRGCDSNGAGKSFLLDGIAWATWGRCVRAKYAGDEVMRRLYERDDGGVLKVVKDHKGNPKHDPSGTTVTVELVGGDRDIRYTRYRKHPTHKDKVRLWVGGEEVTRGRNSMTTEVIENALGMDFITFSNSVAFGARDDIKSFFSASDSERKQILDRILGLEIYSDAQVIAKERHSAVRELLEPLRTTITKLEVLAEEQTTNLLEAEQGGSLAELKSEEASVVEEQEGVRASLAKACLDKAEWASRIEELEEEMAGVVLEHRKAKGEYEGIRATFQNERAEYREARAAKTGLLREAKKSLKDAQTLGGAECPTCGQDTAGEVFETLCEDRAYRTSELQEGITRLDSLVETVDAKLADLVEPEMPEMPDLAKARIATANALARTNTLADRVVALEGRQERLQGLIGKEEGRKKAMKKRLSETLQEAEEARGEMASLEADADQLEFCVEMFGNSGLKSFIIESAIPEINQRATSYVRQLCGDGATVSLSATTSLKSKDVTREKLTVTGSIPGCADTYEGASKGQKKRLDLSLLLAYREIVANRATKGVGQLFADELFDGLDRAGTDGVVELLRDISAECPVIMVTHDDRLKSAGDRMILVRHENGVARVDAGTLPKKKLRRKVRRPNAV
jgi:DNA repair exonuclease SbcCD ATPase subunit